MQMNLLGNDQEIICFILFLAKTFLANKKYLKVWRKSVNDQI